MKRWVPKLGVIAGLTILALLAKPTTAHAYTNGRLMDDQVLDNVSTMNQAQIQSFLVAQGSTCLANYSDIDFNWNGTSWVYGPGDISASEIIYKAAQQWGVNPQVLIATLQKEESLITGTSCDSWRYNSAMGYGCPDGGGCNPKYAGFSKQVLWGAWQLKFNRERSEGVTAWDGDGNITYSGFMTQGTFAKCAGCATNFYSGYATIDNQSIFLENGATASLYSYTPHLNQAFPGIFETWFGSTWAQSYSAQYSGESAWPTFIAGGSSNAFMEYKNVGSAAWYDDTSVSSGPAGTHPVHLSTAGPINRISAFGSGWTNQNRPDLNFSAVYEADGTTLAADQHVVQPGQIAKFNFSLVANASLAPGTYREYFAPVLEGSALSFNDPGTFLDVTVTPIIYSSTYASQSSYPTLIQTQNTNVFIKYQNTGNTVWYDNTGIANAPAGTKPIHLATSRSVNRASTFGLQWNSDRNRPAVTFTAVYESDGTTLAANQHLANPGQIVKFQFNLQASRNLSPGVYREFFQPIVEGGDVMNDPGTFLDVTVIAADYEAAYAGQCNYPSLTAGGASVACYFRYQNVGNIAWYDDQSIGSAPAGTHPIHLATSNPINRASVFGSLWNQDRNRPSGNFSKVYAADGITQINGATKVDPGQIGEYDFSLLAGSGQAPGVYREYFHLLEEGGSTMNDPGTFLDVTAH